MSNTPLGRVIKFPTHAYKLSKPSKPALLTFEGDSVILCLEMISFMRPFTTIGFMLATLACACSLSAGTIVSVTGPQLTAVGLISEAMSVSNPTAFPYPQYIEASWSQTATYNNVAISVLFGQLGNELAGTAYLTTQVGPGTTAANEVASASFLVPNNSSVLYQVLSLPSLGAGTYHLVIVPTGTCSGSPLVCGVGNWWDTSSPVVSADTGVAFLGDSLANTAAGYGPASAFGSESVWHPQEFTVTSDSAVPEPSTFVMACLSIAAISLYRKRQSARC